MSKQWPYLKQGDVVVFVFVFVCTCISFCICNCIIFGDHSPLVETIQGFASKQRPIWSRAIPYGEDLTPKMDHLLAPR